MSDKKSKVMSLSIDQDMQKLLKDSAKKAGVSVSQLIRELVNKHLSLIVNDGDILSIIIDVPVHLKGDEDGLRKLFTTKVNGIVAKLCEE